MDDLVRGGQGALRGRLQLRCAAPAPCLTVRHVDSLQPVYSMLNRGIEAEILPFCREHGIGVVVYSPMAKGLLTGKYRRRPFRAG